MPSRSEPCRSSRPNVVASGISVLAISILYFSSNTETVGADPGELLGTGVASMGARLAPRFEGPLNSSTDKGQTERQSATERTPKATGKVALLMNVLMLEKARSQVSAYYGYTVDFHKQERIEGELQEPQAISMDIRHKPFSVYMKWKNYDKGRQLLYVPHENEGRAMVRLGGFKGRLIPPVKVEPDSARILKESRYPLTKAGMLPVIEAMLSYRKDDVEKRQGVEAEMYDDEMIDGRRVFTFVVSYPNREVSEEYRRAITYLDQKTMLPIRLCNYTWAEDSEGLTPDELDDATLIEDYAFSNLRVANVQVGEADTRFKNKKL